MRAADKYVKENYDKIITKIPKGRKATVKALADAASESVNGYINNLLRTAAGMSVEEWKKASEE